MPADWERFDGFGVAFRYPGTTPRGLAVERTAQERDDLTRVHLSPPDREELYVEVARFVGITPQDEYAQHTPYLEQRFGADAVTELAETRFLERRAWTYAIRWTEEERPMERKVVLLQAGVDTYRLIYDPRSALNERVLETLAFAVDHDAPTA